MPDYTYKTKQDNTKVNLNDLAKSLGLKNYGQQRPLIWGEHSNESYNMRLGRSQPGLEEAIAPWEMPFGVPKVTSLLPAKLYSDAAAQLLKKGAGRVVTNLIQPMGYNNKMSALEKLFTKDGIKAVLKDKALYNEIPGREFPYRKIFGLEPRNGENLYKQIGKDTYSFRPNQKLGLREEVMKSNGSHSVMGRYKQGNTTSGGKYYEDTWDFGLNPGETIIPPKSEYDNIVSNLKRADNLSPEEIKKVARQYLKQEIGVNLAREAINKLINPIVIKGKIGGGEMKKHFEIIRELYQ